MRCTISTHLRYNDIGQVLGIDVQLLSQIELQRMLVMLQVILDAVVDVRDLGYVVRFVLGAEVLLDLAPSATH